jgi:site-specific DNA-methyltransferase (adenine-specific)
MRCLRCKGVVLTAQTGRPPRYCSTACRQWGYRKRHQQKRSVHFSSRSCEWSTPQDLYDRLNAQHGPFTLDACATAEKAKCERFYTRAEDGLAQTWTGRVWLNPPYGHEIGAWMRKALESAATTADLVLCLVPARTDTAWWHDYAERGEVEFLHGRLRFGGAAHSAPFPSALVTFRNAFRNAHGVMNSLTTWAWT